VATRRVQPAFARLAELEAEQSAANARDYEVAIKCKCDKCEQEFLWKSTEKKRCPSCQPTK
jgi:Zn finger protein HypA/HybF involved in hydrogenase expression